MTLLTPDICVIGGGSAGLTVAAAAASFGQAVVLVERGAMGGDCLNYGCVPSKSLIAAAKHAHMARDGARFGVHASPQVNFAEVHAYVHNVVSTIAPHDSVERFEGLGVTVLKADARFTDARTVAAGETLIRARRFVVASGSSPAMPPIEGLSDCAPLTNETVFDLTELPSRLAVIGGGPIGSELAQAFTRLGSAVSVVEASTLLPREDADAAAVVRDALIRDGVSLHENATVTQCHRDGDAVVLTLTDGTRVHADRVLVAAGRTPNLDSLDLEKAGIRATKAGITVDRGLKTTNRRVFAIGDVTGGLQFTHVASHQASLAVRAIVFRLPVTYDPALMPRAIYTAPELAQVGLTAAQAKERDPRATTRTAPLATNDRALTEGEGDGFAKLVISGRGRLVGATLVGPNAGEQAATYALALAARVKLSTLAGFVPAYPTMAEAGKQAAVAHFAEKLDNPWLRRALKVIRRI